MLLLLLIVTFEFSSPKRRMNAIMAVYKCLRRHILSCMVRLHSHLACEEPVQPEAKVRQSVGKCSDSHIAKGIVCITLWLNQYQ